MANEETKKVVDEGSEEQKSSSSKSKPRAKAKKGDGYPVLKLLSKYDTPTTNVHVGIERKVGSNGAVRFKNANVTYSKDDLLRDSLALVGKHPILFLYFEPVTDEEKDKILTTPTSKLSRIQRKRSRLA